MDSFAAGVGITLALVLSILYLGDNKGHCDCCGRFSVWDAFKIDYRKVKALVVVRQYFAPYGALTVFFLIGLVIPGLLQFASWGGVSMELFRQFLSVGVFLGLLFGFIVGWARK